jgi:2,3-bisphosphoglycerate-independent phosphoglycerate mutase
MKKACLIILDGAGYCTDSHGNAVTPDTMPNMYRHMSEHGFAILGATAESVGLEPGQVGNSEAGHLTIGAGRIIPSMTQRICKAFDSGTWSRDPGWQKPVRAGLVHVVGLLSDAGVHGMARTLVQGVGAAISAGVEEIVVHPVLDGVDSRAGTAPGLLEALRRDLEAFPAARLGVVVGRQRFCDRGGDLDVTRGVVDAFLGRAELPAYSDRKLAGHLAQSASEMDFPAHLVAGGRTIRDGEPILITSHRADRARQVARVLSETHPVLMLVDPGKDIEVEHIFFPQEPLDRGFAHEISRHGISSVRVAEKCKFPHVTFFFNGFDAALEGEGVCIPSISESEIPGQPEMSIHEVVDEIVRHLNDPRQRVIVANLANLDQVGHLGRLDLAVKAAEEVDRAFVRIAEQARQNDWTLFVTADHGNADCVIGDDGKPFGSHTHRPVPFLIQPSPEQRFTWTAKEGTLANVAASCLLSLGLQPPEWMEPPLVRFE